MSKEEEAEAKEEEAEAEEEEDAGDWEAFWPTCTGYQF